MLRTREAPDRTRPSGAAIGHSAMRRRDRPTPGAAEAASLGGGTAALDRSLDELGEGAGVAEVGAV